MNSRTLPLFFLLLVGALAFPNPSLHAQSNLAVTANGGPTIVYEIAFGLSRDGINFLPYNSGYYVAPSAGGAGTLILTKSGAANNLYVFTDFGELFVARDGNSRKAVISCTAASNVSSTAFFAIGDASDSLKAVIGPAFGDIYYAATLKGWAVSADSRPDPLFFGNVAVDQGVAGSSALTVTYDGADTNNAAVNSLSVAATVTAIQTRLTGQGFVLAGQTAVSGGPGTTIVPPTTTTGAGDMLVYRLNFTKTGDSINYKHPLGGYYVSYAATTDAGSLILESETNGADFFKEYPNFGSLLVVQSDRERKGVLFATAASTVSTTTFFGLGDARDTLRFNGVSEKNTAYFAKTLPGFAISADSARDLPFAGSDGDLGSGGVSKLTATYDETRSKEANNARRTVAAEVKVLETELKANGFLPLK